MNINALKVTNARDTSRAMIVEPWGQAFEIESCSSLDLVITATSAIHFEIADLEKYLTVYVETPVSTFVVKKVP